MTTHDPKTMAADIAKELRANPGAWTQGVMARDTADLWVSWNSPHACKWCLAGHISKRVGYLANSFHSDTQPFRRAMALKSDTFLSEWNDADERTVDDVIALCDKVATS